MIDLKYDRKVSYEEFLELSKNPSLVHAKMSNYSGSVQVTDLPDLDLLYDPYKNYMLISDYNWINYNKNKTEKQKYVYESTFDNTIFMMRGKMGHYGCRLYFTKPNQVKFIPCIGENLDGLLLARLKQIGIEFTSKKAERTSVFKSQQSRYITFKNEESIAMFMLYFNNVITERTRYEHPKYNRKWYNKRFRKKQRKHYRKFGWAY